MEDQLNQSDFYQGKDLKEPNQNHQMKTEYKLKEGGEVSYDLAINQVCNQSKIPQKKQQGVNYIQNVS